MIEQGGLSRTKKSGKYGNWELGIILDHSFSEQIELSSKSRHSVQKVGFIAS